MQSLDVCQLRILENHKMCFKSLGILIADPIYLLLYQCPEQAIIKR